MAKPASCTGCPLYNAPFVPGDGNPNARLLIIGQCPGPDEVTEGRPFVGASGRILEHAIHKGGNTRAQTFVTNVVKCYVPPKHAVPAEAIRKCQPLLEQDLRLCKNADTILTLGQEAYSAIASPRKLALVHDRRSSRKDSNYRFRGCPERLAVGSGGRSFTVIGSLHPAFLPYSGFALSDVFARDVARAYRFSRGESKLRVRSFNANPTRAEIRDAVAYIVEKDEGSVDIETPFPEDIPEDDRSSSGHLPISVIGISPNTDTAILVGKDKFEDLSPLFNYSDRGSLPKTLPKLWAFNSSFDFYHLRPYYLLDGVTEACSMTLFHMLQPDSPRKDLATMMSMYTDEPFHKYLQDLQPDYYNACDNWGQLEGVHGMLAEMRSIDAQRERKFSWSRMSMEDTFWYRMMPTVRIVRHWEYEGGAYDEEASDSMLLQAMEVLRSYEQWWQTNIPGYSWSSPKQLIELFTLLGAKIPRRKRKNPKTKEVKFTPSVDDEALNGFVSAHPGATAETAKLVQLMRGYKKASDFTGLGKDGKFYTRAKPHGQAGGRVQTVAINLQQIPERCPEFDLEVHPEFEQAPFIEPRNAFIGDTPEDIIISADFSQIEFWIYSYYAKCKRSLEIKASGDYIYGAFYEDIWKEAFFNPTGGRGKANRSPSVPPWKLLVAKSWPLGFIYGRAVPDPADQGLPISKDNAKRIHGNFHRDNPEYSLFHRELEFIVNREGYLQTAFGRLRRFPNPKGQRNEFLAFPGQTSAVDVLLRNALIPLSPVERGGEGLLERFGPRSRVLFTVHDSVICNVTVNKSLRQAQEAYQLVQRTLEQPISELDDFVINCEVKIGPSWGAGMPWEKFERWALANGFNR